MVAGSVGAYENKIVKYFTVHCTKSYFNTRTYSTMYYDMCILCDFICSLLQH